MWTAGWGADEGPLAAGGVRRGTGTWTRGVWWVQGTGRYEGPGTL